MGISMLWKSELFFSKHNTYYARQTSNSNYLTDKRVKLYMLRKKMLVC